MSKLRKVNLQFFAEGEEDFDLDSFEEEFNKDWVEDDNENESSEDTSEEETPEEETSDNEEAETETPQPPSNETAQDNGRWAEMRRQSEQGQAYQNWVNQMAERFEMTPDQFMEEMNNRYYASKAEEQQTTPEVLQRIDSLEQQNRAMTAQQSGERFRSSVENVMKQEGIEQNDPSISKTLEYIAQKGYTDEFGFPTMDFSDAYYIANRENIISKKVEAANQKNLEAKKNRQQSAAIPVTGTGDSPNELDDDAITKEVHDFLKEMGDI